jgi:hypothetical protein
MSPYAFSFKPRNARGGERKPIDNLNGKNLKARTIIEKTLQRIQGDVLTVSSDDETRSIRVKDLQKYDEFTFVEFGVGRAGVVGNLHQRAGTRVPFDADEHNESYVRGLFVFPEAGHEVYWLSERAGNTSTFASLSPLLMDSLRERVPENLTVKFDPVAEWSAVKQWANSVLVQEIRFDAPRPGGSTQAMDVNGVHADVRMTIKPRGSLALSRLLKKDGPDKQAVFGFLTHAPLVKKTTASSVIGAGWKAQVAFKTPGGRQRSFGLATDDGAPTLIYPVGEQGAGVSKAVRPTHRDFAKACAEFLTDVDGRLPGLASVAQAILQRLK